jgi:LysR family transcriptional activator of nhaA
MEGSIVAAAEKLHVSQPTISDQIKLLEEYFDCSLFERRNRSLFLTAPGQHVLKVAQNLFNEANELTQQIRNFDKAPKKSLDIGITSFLTQYFIYDMFVPLFKDNKLSVNIKEDRRPSLLADLEKGLLDLVLTNNKEQLPANTSAYRLGMNKTYVLCHKDLAKNVKSFPSDLSNIPFFNYTEESDFKYEIELYFSKHGVAPQIVGSADDVDVLELITQKGIAFCIVPEAAKVRICRDSNIKVLGEIKDLQTSVWGIVKNTYNGPLRELLGE